MTLWYVYLMWRRPANHDQGVNWGRYLLTFENRYVADEYYITLCSLTTADGRPRFNLLTRTAPQLWAFDSVQETGSGDNGWWWAPIFIWRDRRFAGDLGRFANSVMHIYLSDGNHSQRNDWPILNDQAEGADWLDGGAFYIRNKRHRTRFWHDAGDGFVQVSTTMHTKFRVTRQSLGTRLVAGDAKQVLTRSDVVQVCPVGSVGPIRYIEASAPGKIRLSTARNTIKFGDFFSGLGSTWEPTGSGSLKQFVTRTTDADEGDEWELC
ncbi:hypothetical protein DL765_002813 [Monosporascus sp. GIB2]|nr:hypothetical protein DL765_002813 [Monosporascus sp. GIB2]